MGDATVRGEAAVLLVDGRPDLERGPVHAVLSRHGPAAVAASLEAALAVAGRCHPRIALVHVGLDARPGRPGAGLIVAAELARRDCRLSLVLLGSPREISGWSLLHELGATARFVPDTTAGPDLDRLLLLIGHESFAREALVAAVEPMSLAKTSRLDPFKLEFFSGDLERRLIAATLQQARSLHGAAAMLGLGEAGLRARLRKLGMRPGARSPTRSSRDRLLVVGAGAASRALVAALDGNRCAVLRLDPGALHAGAEARGGARAAVIEASCVDAVVDAWALRRVAPAVPILLHGPLTAQLRAVHSVLDGLRPVLSSESLAATLPLVIDRLLALGHLSCAVDALCVSLGGAGQGPTVPRAIDLRDVISRVEHAIGELAVAEGPTKTKAAELLGMSLRSLRRRRSRRRPSTPRE